MEMSKRIPFLSNVTRNGIFFFSENAGTTFVSEFSSKNSSMRNIFESKKLKFLDFWYYRHKNIRMVLSLILDLGNYFELSFTYIGQRSYFWWKNYGTFLAFSLALALTSIT